MQELDYSELAIPDIQETKINDIIVAKKNYWVKTAKHPRGLRLKQISANPRKLIFNPRQGEADLPVATCSNKYILLEQRKLMEKTREHVLSMGIEPMEEEFKKVGNWQFFHKFLLEKDIAFVEGDDESLYDLNLTVTNSYDSSMGIHVMFDIKRLICANGMSITKLANREHMIHVGSDEGRVFSKVAESITAVVGAYPDFASNLAELIAMKITQDQSDFLIQYLQELNIRKYELEFLSKNGVNALWDEKEGQVVGIAWDTEKVKSHYDILNAVTNLANHVRTHKRELELHMKAYPLLVKPR